MPRTYFRSIIYLQTVKSHPHKSLSVNETCQGTVAKYENITSESTVNLKQRVSDLAELNNTRVCKRNTSRQNIRKLLGNRERRKWAFRLLIHEVSTPIDINVLILVTESNCQSSIL